MLLCFYAYQVHSIFSLTYIIGSEDLINSVILGLSSLLSTLVKIKWLTLGALCVTGLIKFQIILTFPDFLYTFQESLPFQVSMATLGNPTITIYKRLHKQENLNTSPCIMDYNINTSLHDLCLQTCPTSSHATLLPFSREREIPALGRTNIHGNFSSRILLIIPFPPPPPASHIIFIIAPPPPTPRTPSPTTPTSSLFTVNSQNQLQEDASMAPSHHCYRSNISAHIFFIYVPIQYVGRMHAAHLLLQVDHH